MNTTRETSPGWCCIDCLAYLANGQIPDMGADELEEWLERVSGADSGEITLGCMLGEDECKCADWDTDEHREHEEMDFSRSACDVCGSALGGSRHAVTFWK